MVCSKTVSEQGWPSGRAATPLLQATFYRLLLLVSHVTHSHIIKLNTPFCTSSALASWALISTGLFPLRLYYSNIITDRNRIFAGSSQVLQTDWAYASSQCHGVSPFLWSLLPACHHSLSASPSYPFLSLPRVPFSQAPFISFNDRKAWKLKYLPGVTGQDSPNSPLRINLACGWYPRWRGLSLAWQRIGVSLGHEMKQQRGMEEAVEEGGTTNPQEWTIGKLKCTQVVEDEKGEKS